MNCPKCNNTMILTRATSFGEEYQYCRSCKKELAEMQVEPYAQPTNVPDAKWYTLLEIGNYFLSNTHGRALEFRVVAHDRQKEIIYYDCPQDRSLVRTAASYDQMAEYAMPLSSGATSPPTAPPVAPAPVSSPTSPSPIVPLQKTVTAVMRNLYPTDYGSDLFVDCSGPFGSSKSLEESWRNLMADQETLKAGDDADTEWDRMRPWNPQRRS